MGVCVGRMLFSAWGKMELVASQESQDPGSLLPPAPSARRGFVAADTCGQSSSAGRGERKWIHLRVSPGYLRGLSRLRANKEEPWADAAGHPSPSEHPRKMHSGADSASKEGHPGQCDGRGWALLSTGGEQLAVSGRLPLARLRLRPWSSCLRGIFFLPARSWRRLGFLKTVNYAAFVCRVGGWGQG